jgi:hypothetical protein
MPLVRKQDDGEEDPEQDLQESGATFKLDGVDGEIEIVLPPLGERPDRKKAR